ncbi:hypothetical protein [Streptomyces formicae]|uniref:Uncharacterized protein n=1 Tax=Streptomyces formicae TaxID=1616117 RepID=A0ABY3WRC3_9ACTN|nr:hypothetical protein [Streptomyces formicae]UNM13041.1 hypothetical protein J4032_17390 [Streptomyces formicae]
MSPALKTAVKSAGTLAAAQAVKEGAPGRTDSLLEAVKRLQPSAGNQATARWLTSVVGESTAVAREPRRHPAAVSGGALAPASSAAGSMVPSSGMVLPGFGNMIPEYKGPSGGSAAARDHALMLWVRLRAHLEYLLKYGQQLQAESASLLGELHLAVPSEGKSQLYEKLKANEAALLENVEHVTDVQRLSDEAAEEFTEHVRLVGLPPSAGPDQADQVRLMLAEMDMSVAERKLMNSRSERARLERQIADLRQLLEAEVAGDEKAAHNLALDTAQSLLPDNAQEDAAVEALLSGSQQEYAEGLALPSSLRGASPQSMSQAAIEWFQGPSELERDLAPLTSRPGLYLESDGARDRGAPEELASRAQAWLTRQELRSGRQAVALLGRPAARILSGYGEPTLEPVGVTGEAPSQELVAARTSYGRVLRGEEPGAGSEVSAPGAEGLPGHGLEVREDALVRGVKRLRPLAGPMWVVSSAPGSLGTPDVAVASGQARYEGEEFTPWSEDAPYEAPFSRLESVLEHEAALQHFNNLVDQLHIRVGSTVMAGEVSRKTLKSLFSLLTGGVGRFSSTALSGLGSLSMDLTQLALMRGGVKSRTLGLLLGEIKDAPFAKAFEGVKALGEKLGEAAAAAQKELLCLLEKAPPQVREATETVTAKAGGIWSVIKAKARESFHFITSHLTGLWEKVKEAWNKLPAFKEIIEKTYGKVKDFITKNPHAGKVVRFLEKALANLQANVVDLAEKLAHQQSVTELLRGLVDSIDKALRETAPAVAFKLAVKKFNDWATHEGEQFFARFAGGKERFDEHLKSFIGRLYGLTARARDYAISRSLHEGSKSHSGRQITTEHAFLGFRDQSAAFDYALHRAGTEPGDRHMILMRVDLRDWSGRDLGPLLMRSPHHQGQDAMLLPGARLLISNTSVIDTPAGRMELIGAIEQVGDLDIRDQVTDPLGHLGWLAGAPEHGSTLAALGTDVLSVSTRATSFRELAKFVNRYYQGDVEKWVNQLLGDFATEIWQSFRDIHETNVRDRNPLGREVAGKAFRYLGFPEELAILAERLAAGDSLFHALHKVHEYQRTQTDLPFWRRSAAASVTALREMLEKKTEKRKRISRALYTATLIGGVMGLIELLIKAGPENIVDSVLGTKGPLGAGATAAIAHSVIPGTEGYNVVRRTHGAAAAVVGTTAARGTELTHSALQTLDTLAKQPVFDIAGQLLQYVPPWILSGLGTPGTAAFAYKELYAWLQSENVQRFVRLPHWAVRPVASAIGGLAAMAAYLPASFFPTQQTVSLSELGNVKGTP